MSSTYLRQLLESKGPASKNKATYIDAGESAFVSAPIRFCGVLLQGIALLQGVAGSARQTAINFEHFHSLMQVLQAHQGDAAFFRPNGL